MEACAVICRKATVALLDANPFIFEHINGIFVRFCPPGPPFSGISSTKSSFLCAFALRNPRFRASRAQNRGFCAQMGLRVPENCIFVCNREGEYVMINVLLL